jgi:hypothetical protein
MEWDQIAEKWSEMALRLRNDTPNPVRALGTSQFNNGSEGAMTQTPAPLASEVGLSPAPSVSETAKDRALTPDQ